MSHPHVPVLLHEVMRALNPRNGGRYVDLTLGAGGHSEAILQASSPCGQLVGVDKDPTALAIASTRLAPFGERFQAVHASYDTVADVVAQIGWETVDGILLDAGVSSMQLDQAERGFSFRFDAPLDMRMNPSGPTAAEYLDIWSEQELGDIIAKYGEIRGGHRLARAIKESRAAGEMNTTTQLRMVCESKAHPSEKRRSVHPATRVFQAIRIAVNHELQELEDALAAMPSLLAPNGVAAVISFHSLEDRLVKRAFKSVTTASSVPKHLRDLPLAFEQDKIAFRNVEDVAPTEEEMEQNPRARSARLRAIQRIQEEGDA